MKLTSTHYFIIIAVVIFGALIAWRSYDAARPGQYDTFAQCLADSGAIFYGAFWCQHCESQKAMFGNSEKLLNYVECSTPDGQGQTAVCAEAGIQSYPTWEFADGTREVGAIPLAELAEKTSCELVKDEV